MRPSSHKIGLGTAQFGLDYGISNPNGRVPANIVRDILEIAAASGLSSLDTASGYGDSEAVLGKFPVLTSHFDVYTKTAPIHLGIDIIRSRFLESLQLLNRPRLHGLLVHHAQDLRHECGAELWNMMQYFRDAGLVEKIGFSCYVEDDPWELAQRFRPDIIQLPASILDQRLYRSGALDAMSSAGIKLIARSIFLQGLLLMDPNAIPDSLSQARPYIERLRDQAAAHGLSRLELIIQYMLGLSQIDHFVIGVTNVPELTAIIAASQIAAKSIDASGLACQNEAILNPAKWPR